MAIKDHKLTSDPAILEDWPTPRHPGSTGRDSALTAESPFQAGCSPKVVPDFDGEAVRMIGAGVKPDTARWLVRQKTWSS